MVVLKDSALLLEVYRIVGEGPGDPIEVLFREVRGGQKASCCRLQAQLDLPNPTGVTLPPPLSCMFMSASRSIPMCTGV